MSDDTMTPDDGNALSIDDAVSLLGNTEEAETETEEVEEEAPADEVEEAEADEEEAEEESEAESEEDADLEDEDEEDESDAPDFMEVDGERMTVDDVRKLREQSRSFEADYTRKTQKLAEDRRSMQREVVDKVRHLDAVIQRLGAETTQEPDWVKLAEEDPIGFPAEKARWEQRQQDLQTAAAERQALQVQQFNEARQKTAEHFLSGAYRKEWTDPEVMQADLDANTEYAIKTYNVTAEELSQIHDPVLITVLDKARRFDELQKKAGEAPKLVKDKPKVVKSGNKVRAQKTKGRQHQRAVERFNNNPSIENAMDLI